MTLHKDRERNTRPPMRRRTLVIILVVVAAVFGYAIWWTITNGPPLF